MDEENSNSSNSRIILSLYHKNRTLTAASYNLEQKMLYLYQDIIDPEPQYEITRSLVGKLKPFQIIIIGGLSETFKDLLINLMKNELDLSTQQMRCLPKNLSLLPTKEYSFYGCEHSLKCLQLLSEPEEINAEERVTYLQTLVDLHSTPVIYAMGSLVKFVQRSWQFLKLPEDEEPIYAHIKLLTLNDSVYIDSSSFKALRVFQRTNHDSSFKHGGGSSSREGTSLFRLLCQYIVSNAGCAMIRDLLLNPTRNEVELQNRLDFIEFVNDIQNATFVDNILDNVKKVNDLTAILSKIYNSKANADQWQTLYKTIFNVLNINEQCSRHINKCKLLDQFCDSVSLTLYEIYNGIDTTLDFSVRNPRATVKKGIDGNLDNAKRISEDMENRLKAAAATVSSELPDYLHNCAFFFIPNMGHILGVQKWGPCCDPQDLLTFGYHFLFEMKEYLYYKNALCREMDLQLGDLPFEILHHENRVLERLAAFIKRENDNIRKPLENIALIDALISIARVCRDKNYARPKFNKENIHEIKNARDPILEMSEKDYVANSFYSGGPHSHIKIITGPNSSGKSVYLKQTAVCIYMAHLGCFVPAKSANISLVHSMHIRMQTRESAALNLSNFMTDISMMALALHHVKANSLILVDEFGRGTTGKESKVLLTGALRYFLNKEEGCPHIVVATHMKIEKRHVDSPLVLYQKMEHTITDSNELLFLFKVTDGESDSLAIKVAHSFDEKVLKRAQSILKDPMNIQPLPELCSGEIETVNINGIPIRIPSLDN